MIEMKRLLNNAMTMSHMVAQTVIQPGDIVIDATAGNGHDTALLLSCVGPNGRVYGFDIQETAIANLQAEYETDSRLNLICASHEYMSQHIDEPVSFILFNLGYLPKGDHEITTRSASTLVAVKDGLGLLSPHGVLVIVVYRGHPEGAQEWAELLPYIESLDQRAYNVTCADFPNQLKSPPLFIGIQRRK